MFPLDTLRFGGDLELTAPGGGRIRLESTADHTLRIRAGRDDALWQLLRTARTYAPELRPRRLRDLRNPLSQTVELYLDGEQLMEWPTGTFPRVRSWRALFRLLRER